MAFSQQLINIYHSQQSWKKDVWVFGKFFFADYRL